MDSAGHCLVCYQFLTPENIHGLDDTYIPKLCKFLNLPPQDFVEVLSGSFYCEDCRSKVRQGCDVQNNFEKLKLHLDRIQKQVYSSFTKGFNASINTTNGQGQSAEDQDGGQLGLEGLYMQRFLIVQQLDLAGDVDVGDVDVDDETMFNYDNDNGFDGEDEMFNYTHNIAQVDDAEDYNKKNVDDKKILGVKKKVKLGVKSKSLRKGIKKRQRSKTGICQKIRPKRKVAAVDLGLELTICQICGLSFRNNYIQVHMAKHDESLKPFMCQTCGLKFAKTNRLRKHEKESKCSPEHQAKPRWKCKLCNLSYLNKTELKDHIDELHPDEELDIKCSTCFEIFSRPAALELHIKAKHFKLKDIECELCDYKCTVQKFLQVHIARHHTGGERKHKCTQPDCSKAYFTSFALKRHIKSHTGGKDFNCYICGNSYVENRNLQRHMKIKHPTTTTTNIKKISY